VKKVVMGCQTEMEELKNRHRGCNSMTERKKGTGSKTGSRTALEINSCDE